jgi:hypothetical protein
MPVLTLKVLAGLLQLHGPDAAIGSDHQGIDALLADVRGRISKGEIVSDTPAATEVVFRRAGFIKGGGGGGVFRKAAAVTGGGGGGAFRRGAFRRY